MIAPERFESTQLPEGLQSAQALVYNAVADALTPDPKLYVSEWADEFRHLSSKTSAEYGRWETSRVPFMREIMDAMSLSHPATDMDLMKGTQIAGSESLYNALGQIMHQVPCPAMLVMPTTDTAKRISRTRLQPMIDDSPALAGKVAERKSRDSSNTMMLKDFPGGYLALAGANSGPGLRSSPIRFLAMDEIDAYPDDVDGEGDPCAVAEKRTDTFGRHAKKIGCGSPKIKGKSRIDRRYNRGTRARYHVPCPHCGFLQWLKWLQVRWEMEKRRELVCAECSTVTEVHGEAPAACPHCEAAAPAESVRDVVTDDVAEAWYECEACNARIDEYHKTAMFEEWPKGQARHIHESPGVGEILDDNDPHRHAIWAWINGQVRRFLPRFRRPLSWQVSGLYSPFGWFSWRQAVMQLLEAKKGGYNEETGESLLQVFHNTVLGEAFEVVGEQPREDVLKLRAEPYELGQVPAGALMLTGSADFQGDRIEIKVKGYGRGQESWLVDYQRIHYPVGAKKPSEENWQELLAIRDKAYPHAGGQTLRMSAMALDTGHLAHEVYQFVRMWGARKHIIAIKGASERGKPLLGRPKPMDVNHNGKIIKAGVQLWMIGTDTGKELVYGRLDIAEPGPGYMHFPRGLPDEYYEGLTAEKLIRKTIKGSVVNEWIKTIERNEPLDLEVYCQAAAVYAGVQRVNWDLLQQVLNPEQRDLFAARTAVPVQTSAQAGEENTGTDAAPSQAAQDTAPVNAGADAAPVPIVARPPRRRNWVTGFRG